MRSTRRTTLRTAAVVAGAATVLALPVGSAFADSPAVPGPPVGPSVDSRVAPARAFVTAVKLTDGSIAKVYRVGKLGENHFEADIYAAGTKLDTLVSRGSAAAYGQSNGLHVVLQPNGTVTSWLDGAPKPQPKPDVRKHGRAESSVRVAVPDGRIAKLADGPRGKRVVISMPNGNVLGVIDLKRPSTQNDGWTYKLVHDGKRVKFFVIDGKGGGNSWVYDFDGRLIEKYTVDAPVAARGSGSGTASADAAGLGFAVLLAHPAADARG
ncbi:hypothetical protein [Streptomyces virginiae]|uniref:hypothetical protein n=1 Tax=Streptomyces virginiae TaxID=1961 RepID=UPI0004C7346C|nr:hypothetical protein [Streptomyces virginiae]